MKENKFNVTRREFDLAWQEFFKDKPKPKNDEEERKQHEEFGHWYNHIRKQSDTGKTPAEMYKEIYGEEPPKDLIKPSRVMSFGWDEDYDEELVGLIEELKEYDNDKGYKLDYETVRKKLEPIINEIIKKGESALDSLYELLEKEETWSCLFSLEILKEIKSEKSISYLIKYLEKNEGGNHFENYEIASQALKNMGKTAVEEIICSLENGLKNKIHHGYLFETLSKINSEKGKKFRLKILKDFIDNPKKYKGWFELTLFICDFNENDKEALPLLKQLKEMNLTEEEKCELESAIEIIENPEEWKKKLEEDAKKLNLYLKR